MWEDDFTSLPTFQGQYMADLDNVFFNVEAKEFVAPHLIGGIRGRPPVNCNVAVDFESCRGRNVKDDVENISINGLVFFIKKAEWEDNFGEVPNNGASLKFDGRPYQIEDVVDVFGTLKVTLYAMRG